MITQSRQNVSRYNELIEGLADEDGLVRESCREELVEIGGHDVTRELIFELNDPRRDVRWEAAKALIEIADPIAASALAHHLLDEDGDIRWLAAEGLAALGEPGLLVTLNAAIRHAMDTEFCHAAHHAFKAIRKHSVHFNVLDPVIEACEHSEPGVALPVEAYNALQKIKQIKQAQPRETAGDNPARKHPN